MNDDNFIISGFDSKAGNALLFAADFAEATPLGFGGSTCDAFECIVQRRRVFVKRLKEQYRDNPLYLDAFNKEFDLGVTLSHPSLARYIGFGGDYIVMDFVEGETLAELINRGDSRLSDKHFVKKLLLNLIDVVEYLHNRNIIHCDIKADNIIISPYPDRPPTLIDFDKAYSPWLDSSHGNAGKYGCEGCADGVIDFRGIGLIAEKLGRKKVANACKREDVNADSLRRLLRSRKNYLWWILCGGVIVAGVAVLLFIRNFSMTDDEGEKSLPVLSEKVDSIDESIIPSQSSSAAVTPMSIDRAWLESLIAEQAVEFEAITEDLLQRLDSDSISVSDKRDLIMDFYGSDVPSNRVLYSAIEKYRNLSEPEVQTLVRNNPAWIRLHNAEGELDRRINEWSAKFQIAAEY